ncbi:MAG: LutB/LldF family L-lactate oxidation iron-sulfur protein, partial [Deltaproteobacteria bacterium]|nr:LutB/LldF family L-lactate oxidation iron-sulfur protein [Deltaproteobacteria bacterium]
MMKPNRQAFQRESALAVNNTAQRLNLTRAMHTIRQRRQTRFDELQDSAALRGLGGALKQECLSRLPELLVELESNLTRNGVRVHWAETAAEANAQILEIARRNKVRLVVKGKSMVSEEIGLNDYLSKNGIQAVEADLGEFIVQLAGQTPSHIVVPAVHMDRTEIARRFHEALGTEYSEDPTTLTWMARKVLREHFQQAGMGVTGVNFAVAETGTLALVENEGNGRMVTTVPPVHVALMGLEKVVARLDQVPPLLRLLTRSATGQAITSYNNWILGPRKEREKDGPHEVHLIILDNGRSAIYADAQLRETLDCIRCGACLNICPVYERVGGHAYGSVYMGPIGKILTPQMAGLKSAGHLAQASTLCGACYQVCPVKIPIPELLLRLRQEAVEPTPTGRVMVAQAGRGRRALEALVWKGWSIAASRPALYRATLFPLKMMGGLFGGLIGGFLAGLTPPGRAWARTRTLPVPRRA